MASWYSALSRFGAFDPTYFNQPLAQGDVEALKLI
jgi:hypothetical protein